MLPLSDGRSGRMRANAPADPTLADRLAALCEDARALVDWQAHRWEACCFGQPRRCDEGERLYQREMRGWGQS